MLDIKFIRENPDKVKKNCENRHIKVDINKLLKIDKEKREKQKQLEEIYAKKNKATKEIQKLENEKKKKKIISEMKKIDKKINEEFKVLMYQIPNICFDDVPVGDSDEDNVVIREMGKKPKFKFQVKDYLEIAEKLDLIDTKRASKVSGTRFSYLKGEAVLIEFALINLIFDILIKQGFKPIIPPVLVKSDIMKAMGYIDSKEDIEERYFFEKDNLFLVGTSEQSIGPMHKDEIFQEKELPKRYVAFSSCFREEAGSYGKDTKGILRVHQFDKVEMFSFCKPNKSVEEHQFLLSLEEKLMQTLKIPYRVVKLCTGDMARPSATTFDIEAWMPGQKQYRETHSVSNCTDFQTRRLNIRYQRKEDKKLDFVHALNGTAFAIGRTIIAIIENYQQEDGSIKMPKALQKYLGFELIK